MIRSLASGLLGIVALVAVALTLPTAWVALNIADEDGYVEFTAPFATDDELRDALATGIGQALVEGADLPIGQGVVVGLADAAFMRLVDEPGFQQAWERTQRASHQATFEPADQRSLVLDIGPLLTLVAEAVSDQVPVDVGTPESVLVPLTQDVQPRTIDAVRAAPDQALLGVAVAAVATIGSLLLARRRGTALGLWGLGVAGVGGAYMLLTNRGIPELLERRPEEGELATTMRDLLVSRATASLDEWLLMTVVVGAAATVIGFGIRIVRR